MRHKAKAALRRWAQMAALVAILASAQTSAMAQESAEADANNPLANVTAFNIQNYYIDRFTELPDNISGNQTVLRFAQPLQIGNTNWLLRASLPYNTFPVGPGFDDESGLGDADLFLAYQFDTQPGISFGIGPQIVFPTATEDLLGGEQWQLGVANVFFDGRSPKFQYGYLLIYRAGVGDVPDDRDYASTAAFQPFGFYQFGNGWYTGGAPIWTYNFNNDNYSVPFGLRLGKVNQYGDTTANFFIEPQWSIANRGPGQPEFQIYAAINLQFR